MTSDAVKIVEATADAQKIIQQAIDESYKDWGTHQNPVFYKLTHIRSHIQNNVNRFFIDDEKTAVL